MLKNSIVVNWHLLESCQLKCKYCYAEWNKEHLPLIFKNKLKSEKLIQEIALLKQDYHSVRLSFAGGEPLLDGKLTEKISYAYQQGLKVSVITNGDLLTEDFLYDNCPKIDVLGVSIDSANDITNLKIGRATLLGKIPEYRKIIQLIKLAKTINPNIEIKINTVVNQFNFNEDMNVLINAIQPNKWKVLRVLPATDKASMQQISDAQFDTFVNQHRHNKCSVIEDNNDMLNSYLMIEPYGRFFYNQKETIDYGYSSSIYDVGIYDALKGINFDYKKFTARY